MVFPLVGLAFQNPWVVVVSSFISVGSVCCSLKAALIFDLDLLRSSLFLALLSYNARREALENASSPVSHPRKCFLSRRDSLESFDTVIAGMIGPVGCCCSWFAVTYPASSSASFPEWDLLPPSLLIVALDLL